MDQRSHFIATTSRPTQREVREISSLSEEDDAVDPSCDEVRRGGIDVARVSHWFDRDSAIPTIAETSFHVRPGEFVVIVGPSGCGKTTVLNIIAGLIKLQSGTVSIRGNPSRPGNRDVGYMLARDALLGWRTALGNVEFGAAIRGRDKAERRTHGLALMKQVGLGEYTNVYIKTLSQGMRQRVALARTFCLNAPVLLMDEPFAALDPLTKIQLENVLLDLWTKERRTVLFITHDVSEAIALADRVIVMQKSPGRVVTTLNVDIPRPRDIRKLQVDSRFHQLQTIIWDHLGVG